MHAPVRGALLVGGSIVTDAFGAVWRIRKTSARAALPRAHARNV